MANKNKILSKIGDLLTRYGVSEQEKANFLADLQDGQLDDQEEIKEPENVDEKPMEEPTEPSDAEPMGKEEESTEPVGDEEPQEEVGGSEPVEEPIEDEPQAELPQEQGAMEEQPMPEQPQEPSFDYEGKYNELQGVIEGLRARLESLQDALSKSGVLVMAQQQENPVGVENNQPDINANIPTGTENVLAKLNK